MAINEICMCGKITTVTTTNEGEYCDECFNKKYGTNYKGGEK